MIISSLINNNDLFDIVNIGKDSLPIYYNLYHLIKIITNTKYIILKCILNDNIIGFVIIKKYKNNRIHIMSIAFLKIYRGLGYGSILLDKIKELFPNYKISLNVQTKNDTAVRFYIKNKFKIKKTIYNYYEELEFKDAYYCVFTPALVSI